MFLRKSILAAAISLAITPVLFAAETSVAPAPEHHGHGDSAPAPASARDTTLTSGEVRKLDAGQGKITIQHEAITNLGMPGMTMVFRAEPASLLGGVKVGDKIRFHAESQGGALIVTDIVAHK